ncbi:hypothetical protein DSI35_02395, partial [Mycobacterium tuberculosis]
MDPGGQGEMDLRVQHRDMNLFKDGATAVYRAAPGDAVPALNAATRTPAQGGAGRRESGAQALPMQGRAGVTRRPVPGTGRVQLTPTRYRAGSR